ncbi:MAG: 5'-nucleotidase C-terminal domain-containing protein, partial [Bacteroidaceae bacterium]
IIEREGVKIAILGQITDAIPAWLPKEIWSGLRFENMVKNTNRWIAKINKEEKPDFIVGLFHSGLKGGIINEAYYENASYKVANEVEGFDLIFYGHDHSPKCIDIVNKFGKHVLLANAGAHATNVASAVVNFQLDKSGKVISKSLSTELIDATVYPESSCFVSRFDKDLKSAEDFVSAKVAYFNAPVDGHSVLFGSSAFVDLIHQMQLAITGADISLSSPLSISATIDAGPVYMRDLFNLYKYENVLYTMKLTGQEIHDELEFSYGQWVNTMKSKEDHLLLLDDKNNLKYFSFNFDSAAGIIYDVDVTKPVGKRINIKSMANGKPFSLAATYSVAVNSYRGNGGGELLTKGAGISPNNLDSRITNVSSHDLRYYLMKYLLKKKVITPEPLNQWSFVPKEWVKEAAYRDSLLIFSPNVGSHQ